MRKKNIAEEHSYVDEKHKLLIVDDDVNILKLIKKFFTNEDIDVLTAENGKDAVEILTHEPEIRLIILDVMLPDISGLELCRKIRESKQIYELPIIILTAKNEPQDVVQAFDAGANDYIAKPFEKSELIARTKNLINLSRLINANEKLQDAIEFKNQIIQMTIHDLRNPLTIIIGLTNVMKMESVVNAEQQELINVILDASQLMLNMINEILHNVRIDSGKLIIKREEIDMNIIALEVIEKNRRRAMQKGQKIIYEPAPNNNSFIISDKLRLTEIIDNLISNAIKFSERNKRIWVSISKVSKREGISNVGALNENSFVRLAVRDEGPGLTDEDKENIFGRFQKLSAMPTDGEHSMGIGLSIVKQLVELLDGTIWVESEYGKGCTFFVEFKEKKIRVK